MGSSPLARGLLAGTAHDTKALGIIPARAGFTTYCGPTPWPARDHPRSRGVYARAGAGRPARRGSSPLARGLPGGLTLHAGLCRIIPARAGFTRRRRAHRGHARDHPRSRGVYRRPSRTWLTVRGSSPLARGLRHSQNRLSFLVRIIPARAGFTSTTAGWCPPPRDHPRSRGVYSRRGVNFPRHRGSSPLARGLLSRSCQ